MQIPDGTKEGNKDKKRRMVTQFPPARMGSTTRVLLAAAIVGTLWCSSTTTTLFFFVAGQGCSNRCPPNNYGTIVPALCAGDAIEEATSSGGAAVGVDVHHVYDVCYPNTAEPHQFTWNDFRGPSNTVTVIANYYTGCNAGRRESGYVV